MGQGGHISSGTAFGKTGMEKSGSTGRRVPMAMTRQEQSSLARSTLHCLDLDMNLRFRIKNESHLYFSYKSHQHTTNHLDQDTQS